MGADVGQPLAPMHIQRLLTHAQLTPDAYTQAAPRLFEQSPLGVGWGMLLQLALQYQTPRSQTQRLPFCRHCDSPTVLQAVYCCGSVLTVTQTGTFAVPALPALPPFALEPPPATALPPPVFEPPVLGAGFLSLSFPPQPVLTEASPPSSITFNSSRVVMS